MRISCPFCGARDLTEFTYLGDAAFSRPDTQSAATDATAPAGTDPQDADAQRRFVEAVYLRDNPAGLHAELWYHAFGCRSWLRVTRDTRTHEIFAVGYANPEATA